MVRCVRASIRLLGTMLTGGGHVELARCVHRSVRLGPDS
jgi:hypothetical protein